VTGAALQTLEGLSNRVNSVAFSPDGKLEPALSVAEQWVVKEGQNILWLPPDYRATCEAVRNNVVVLGHSSGGISLLEFDERLKRL
jgi:WD40 repeat protein